MPLEAGDLAADPLAQFERWFEDARAAGIPLSEAVALATATPDGRSVGANGPPEGLRRARIRVLHQPREPQGRRARGQPARRPPLPLEGAQPPGARRGRHNACKPGRGRGIRAQALAREPAERARLAAEPADRRVASGSSGGWPSWRASTAARCPYPTTWGGYRVVPDAYEFWQSGAHRLHDRFRYLPVEGGGWAIERLGPLGDGAQPSGNGWIFTPWSCSRMPSS